jgi:hypothetical protein
MTIRGGAVQARGAAAAGRKTSRLDLRELGMRLAFRKGELSQQMK